MSMKQTFLILIVFANTFICVGQNITKEYSFLKEYVKKEKRYERKAKFLIKKNLIKENIYNNYTAKKLLKGVDYLLVPMFKAKLNNDINYANVDDFLSSLNLCKKPWFHEVFVFNEDTLIGIYICDEIGTCGFSLCSDTPGSFGEIMKDIQRIKNTDYDHVFYVHGILHAWWIVKGSDMQVYYLLDGNFYDPQDFLDKYYTDDKIRKIIMYFR